MHLRRIRNVVLMLVAVVLMLATCPNVSPAPAATRGMPHICGHAQNAAEWRGAYGVCTAR